MTMAYVLNSLGLALILAADLTSALMFDGPKPTRAAAANGDEPQVDGLRIPPPPPSAMETAAPDLKRAELAKRGHYVTELVAPDNTCGYQSGASDIVIRCGLNYRCDFFLSFYTSIGTPYGVIQCCPTTGGCSVSVVTTCYNSLEWIGGASCTDLSCIVCSLPAFPFCNGATFPGLGVQGYDCGPTFATTNDEYYTTYDNQLHFRSYAVSSYFVTDDGASTSTSASPSSASAISSSSVPTPSQGSTGPPIGAIVGGVIGGVALLAGIIILVWFIKRRPRQQQPPPAPQPIYVPYPPYSPPPPFDPKAPFVQQSPVQTAYPQYPPHQQPPVYFYGRPAHDQQPAYAMQPIYQNEQQSAHPPSYDPHNLPPGGSYPMSSQLGEKSQPLPTTSEPSRSPVSPSSSSGGPAGSAPRMSPDIGDGTDGAHWNQIMANPAVKGFPHVSLPRR